MGFKKEEDIAELVNAIPKRKLSDMEKQLLFILIERSKVQRESSMSIVNKGFMIFFVFLAIVYFGKLNNLVSQAYINILFGLGIGVLIFSIVSYYSVVRREEKILNRLLESYLK